MKYSSQKKIITEFLERIYLSKRERDRMRQNTKKELEKWDSNKPRKFKIP